MYTVQHCKVYSVQQCSAVHISVIKAPAGGQEEGSDGEEMSRSIKLPQTIDIALRNIKDAKVIFILSLVPLLILITLNPLQIFAMDIGGSLTKIAYYSVLPFKKIVYDPKVGCWILVTVGCRGPASKV